MFLLMLRHASVDTAGQGKSRGNFKMNINIHQGKKVLSYHLNLKFTYSEYKALALFHCSENITFVNLIRNMAEKMILIVLLPSLLCCHRMVLV